MKTFNTAPHIPALSMTLAPVQRGIRRPADADGRWVPDTTGSTLFCLNMRERTPGRLEAVAPNRTLSILADRPVASDLRESRRYVFSQATDGGLWIEGYVSEADASFTPVRFRLATLPEAVDTAGAAGMFLVFRLADGRLWYLLWHPDLMTYSVLGFPPDIPAFRVWREDGPAASVEIPAIEFKKPVEDMRGGIPDEVAAAVRSAATGAWTAANSAATTSEAWVQPVRLRLAVRLWDGSVLAVSRPEVVGGQRGFFTGGRITLRLESSSSGFTGTRATAFQLPTFRVGVEVGSHNLGLWADVVRSIEVWASADVDADDHTAEPAVFHIPQSDYSYLGTNIPARSDAELTAALAASHDCRIAAFEPFFSGTVSLRRIRAPRVECPLPAGPAPGSLRAGAISGHGSFLHLADITESRPVPLLPAPLNEAPYSDPGAGLLEVAVALNTPQGRRWRRAEYRTLPPSAGIGPLLWYPSARAVLMTVRYTAPGGARSGVSVRLEPAPAGEDAALYVHDALASLPLEPDYFPDIPDDDGPVQRLPSAVVTMRPGNPFVAAGTTEVTQGTVSALAAQPSGGGAFTRQYIYAFSDRGVTALTHDPQGRHTNFRPLSPEPVTSPRRVVAAESGVYTFSDRGSLIRLHNALASVLLSDMPAASALVWHSPVRELWILPAECSGCTDSLVIQPVAEFRAYVRSGAPESVVCASGIPLFSGGSPKTGFFLEMPDADVAPQRDALSLTCRWVSASVEAPDAPMAYAAFGVEGDGVEARLAVHSVADSAGWPPDPSASECILALDVAGLCSSAVTFPIRLPAARSASGRLSARPTAAFDLRTRLMLEVSGHLAALTGARISNL